MGKAQKKKAMRHRHNPIRVPDSHLGPGLAAANASAASTKRDAILPIMQKLESPDATERAWACAAVSNLISNDPSTRRLLQGKNVVGALISRLSDNVDEVVVEACGALRNLAIDGGFDICGEMYNKHVMEPLKGFVPKISSAFAAYLSSTAPANDSLALAFQLAENAVTLFCLTYAQETSNKSLNSINNIGLVPFLIELINTKSRFPAKLVVAAAQCLYVLTDDNTPAVEALHADGSAISSLLAIAQAPNQDIVFGSAGSVEQIYSLRVLSCGILKNVSPLPPSSAAADVDLDRTIILPLFVPLLSLNLTAASETVYNLASKPTNPIPPELRHTPMSDHRTPDEKELERIETELLTVQLCLEILTGVCANLPEWDGLDASKQKDMSEKADHEEDEGEGEDNDDDDEMMDDAEANPSRPKVVDSPSVSPCDVEDLAGTPTSLLNTLTSPLLALARPTSLSFPPPALPSVHPPTTSVLGAIHVRALECLNNLFVGVKERPGGAAAEDLSKEEKELVQGAVDVWNQMWSADLLGAIGEPPGTPSSIDTPGQERRAEMWKIAVGVLWGLARIGKGALNPNEQQVTILAALCDSTKEDRIQVQCIGTLGCLAQCQSAIAANLVISQYLLAVLTAGISSTPTRFSAEPTLQAASSIIDIFADENNAYDGNFGVAKIQAGLSESIKGARKQVRAIDSRKPGGRALKAWADGVLGDLTGFVEYRRKLGR